MIHRVFAVADEKIDVGARVAPFSLKGAGVEIPAILVGEEGRGRALGVLPVAGVNPGDTLLYAEVGATKGGKPKLIARSAPTTDERAIVVLRSPIGFRGSNEHTGDRLRGYYFIGAHNLEEVRAKARELGLALEEEPDGIHARIPEAQGLALLEGGLPDWKLELRREFHPFPGDVLVRGVIAEGEAGRMGSGEQLVAVVPRGVWFRVGFSGRRYGAPRARYYRFEGDRLVALTWEERQLTEGEYAL